MGWSERADDPEPGPRDVWHDVPMSPEQARREVEEGRAFAVGLLIGVGISVVIVLGVFLAVLLTL
jgi:hypothetical protein